MTAFRTRFTGAIIEKAGDLAQVMGTESRLNATRLLAFVYNNQELSLLDNREAAIIYSLSVGGQMPLYEYRCQDCGETIETIQKVSDSPLSECEACGGTLERLLSPSAIKFKGSGWYVNDYGKKDRKGSTEKRSSEKTTSASDSKSDSSTEKGDSKK
jgi:putative FmdB family regulatory protein